MDQAQQKVWRVLGGEAAGEKDQGRQKIQGRSGRKSRQKESSRRRSPLTSEWPRSRDPEAVLSRCAGGTASTGFYAGTVLAFLVVFSLPIMPNRNTEPQLLLTSMAEEKPTERTGNEPSPLLLIAVAVLPLLGVLGWLVGLFG